MSLENLKWCSSLLNFIADIWLLIDSISMIRQITDGHSTEPYQVISFDS